MARRCQITGKKTTAGNNRPFSMKATKRVFRPNLFVRRMFNPETGKVERMKLSAKAIRTLKKWAGQGAAAAGDDAQTTTAPVKGQKAVAGDGKHVKKEKLTPKQKKEQAAAEVAAKKEAGEAA